ncbi:MAG: polyprenyl synthetase family protein [Planctomycetes bacterium]|nr:polyprenyl synthetase family protein [Planctomycetota bacterium]
MVGMFSLGEKHKAIEELLAAELGEVEARFAAELVSDLSCVNDLARHLEQYRGKMLRPLLVMLSGLATSSDGQLRDEHRTLATVVEMVHMATLVHDDVLDEQDVRRKVTTINQLRGNEAAVMLGDYLISHSYHLCSSLDSQAAARLIAATTNTVCEGELLQLHNRNNWSLDEQTYFDIIRRKTASLCGVGCRLGAMFSGADRHVCDEMNRYGELIGAAFQIIDDVLDLTGDASVVGKSLGKDLEKGKLTLPLIHRLETAAAADRQMLLNLLRTPGPDQARKVGQVLIDSDALPYARRRAEQFIEQAKAALMCVSDSPARATLMTIADAVINRSF